MEILLVINASLLFGVIFLLYKTFQLELSVEELEEALNHICRSMKKGDRY